MFVQGLAGFGYKNKRQRRSHERNILCKNGVAGYVGSLPCVDSSGKQKSILSTAGQTKHAASYVFSVPQIGIMNANKCVEYDFQIFLAIIIDAYLVLEATADT